MARRRASCFPPRLGIEKKSLRICTTSGLSLKEHAPEAQGGNKELEGTDEQKRVAIVVFVNPQSLGTFSSVDRGHS